MNYLTETDKTILLATAVGLISGSLINLQEIAIARWKQKQWLGWDFVISKLMASAAIQAIIFGAGTFVWLLFDTQSNLNSINHFLIFYGALMGFGWPIFNLSSEWIVDKAGELFSRSS